MKRLNRIVAEGSGVSNCLNTVPGLGQEFCGVERGSVLGLAKRKAVQLGLPPF